MSPLLAFRIELPPAGSRRRLRALYEQLRAAILDGRLRPGLRLPSSRVLAQSHGLARATVVATYDRLLAEGYLASRAGSGTYVADGLPARARPRATIATSDARIAPHWRDAREVAADEPPPIDFRVGLPERAGFPLDLWRRLLGRALRLSGRAGLDVPRTAGRAALCAAIATHVSFTRAVACQAEDVVVTAGAQQAFDLIARVLVTAGRTCVAVEEPGYPPLRAALAAAGARIVAVPVDDEGLVVERIPRDVRAIFVTPSHQFPLGVTMSLERRTALLELARARGAAIVEDDYDSEFRYGPRPLEALQTLDRADSVLYVGTFSKTLSPSLRTGFIVAPAWARAALTAAKRDAGDTNPAVIQDALALMIDGGHLARHVRRMQRRYEARRARLLAGLATLLPELAPVASSAGLHVTAWLPQRIDPERLVARAGAEGVGMRSLAPYFASGRGRPGLVLGYGDIADSQIDEGLKRLKTALDAARPGRPR